MLASSGVTNPSEIFIWKGGITANPVQQDDGFLSRSSGHGFTTATYFNAVENWFVQIEGASSGQGASGPGSSPVTVRPATRIPEGGDVVKFMALPNDPYNGLTGGPWPKNPCLWGGMGFTGDAPGNTGYQWVNAAGQTTNHRTGLAAVYVEESYGRTAGNLGRGWRLGLIGGYDTDQSFDGLTASKDGIVWDGLYLGATRFYNKMEKYGTFLRRLQAGGFDAQGDGVYTSRSTYAKDVILGGTMGAVNLTIGGPKQSFEFPQLGVNSIYKFNSIRSFVGYFGNSADTFKRKIMIAPADGNVSTDATVVFQPGVSAAGSFAGIDVVFDCGISNELSVIRNFAGTRLEGASANSPDVVGSMKGNKVIVARNLDTGQATRRSINKVILGDGDAQGYGMSSGANLEIACGATIANLDVRSGSFNLNDELFADEHISVVKGSIHGGEVNYFSLLSPDTRLRIGTGGNTFDDGVEVFSSDAVFRFSPNTYVKAAQGFSGAEASTDSQAFNRQSPTSNAFSTSRSSLADSIEDKLFD